MLDRLKLLMIFTRTFLQLFMNFFMVKMQFLIIFIKYVFIIRKKMNIFTEILEIILFYIF